MITKILHNKLIWYSLFFGFVTSLIEKEEITLLLLKINYYAISRFAKYGILASLTVLISILFFFLWTNYESIYRKIYSIIKRTRILLKDWIYFAALLFIIIFTEVLVLNWGFVFDTFTRLEERHYSINDGSLFQFDLENGALVSQDLDPNFTINDINMQVHYISIKCSNSVTGATGQVFYRDEKVPFNESMSVRYNPSLPDIMISLPQIHQVLSLRFDLTNTSQDIITCSEFVINPRIPYEWNQTRLAIYAGLFLLSIFFRRQIAKYERIIIQIILVNFGKLKTFIKLEVVSLLRLLPVIKKNILEYFSSPYRIIIIILFSILFLPHAFVVVNNISFISAFESDAGSIISNILALYRTEYNMNLSFHSARYGWTYFSLNYFLLFPIYIIVSILNFGPYNLFLFVSIRLILFMIGLASVLAFYEVAKRILKQNFIGFIASILYIASPMISRFFYFAHPETTGLLFLFISILCLIRYYEGLAKDHRWYTLGLSSLVLSVLSKQQFVLLAPSVIFLYYYFYCHYHKKSLFRFFITKQFVRVSIASIVLSVAIFFIINPYAFIQPHMFIENQFKVVPGLNEGSSELLQGLGAWFNILKGYPIILFSILSFPFTILGVFILRRGQSIGKVLYIVNILSALLYGGIISIYSISFFSAHYFVPIYPFLILNFLSVFLYIIRKSNVSLVKFLLTFSLFSIIVVEFSASLPMGYDRLMYQDGTTYKVYTYIEENIPESSKIAHDHTVGVPSNIKGCHYWNICARDYIEGFQPDYVIFNEDYSISGVLHAPTARLHQYINDHNFVLITTIEEVSVWKKPDK
jgi:hypothetical protein